MGNHDFLDSSAQNHAEPLWNHLRKSVFGSETCEIGPISLRKLYGHFTDFICTFLRLLYTFTKKCVFHLQTTFFDGFNVLLNFLAEKIYRTNMKLPQQASFGPEMCEIGLRVWFLASGFCHPRLGEPSARFRGNPNGASRSTALQEVWIRTL